VEPGTGLYVANCGACHGVPGVNSGGNVPNLGYSTRETLENLPHLVLNGAFLGNGMPNFAGRLDEAQVLQIRAFILGQVDTVRPTPAR
jgi:quinohemoprotein ethanol dehydrogenase